MQSEKLLQSLLDQVKQITAQAEELKKCDLNTLNWRENPTSWNILECLEHLNLYGNYYLPIMEHHIKTSTTTAELEFKSGFWGDYFAKSILPKEKLNKIKSIKSKNPLNANLDAAVIEIFLDQQRQLIELLNLSKEVSLNKVKIPISIAPFIKLKLGDTYQFYINHIIRHFKQIDRINLTMLHKA